MSMIQGRSRGHYRECSAVLSLINFLLLDKKELLASVRILMRQLN